MDSTVVRRSFLGFVGNKGTGRWKRKEAFSLRFCLDGLGRLTKYFVANRLA